MVVALQEDHASRRPSVPDQAEITEITDTDCEIQSKQTALVSAGGGGVLLGCRGDAHGVGLSDLRAVGGFIEPGSKLLDRVQRHKLILFKALRSKRRGVSCSMTLHH